MPTSATPEALIIGAGPCGLTLACELLRRGIDVRIIEKELSRTDQSRALGLQARTLEIFEKMGVIGPFLQHGLRLQKGNFYFYGKPLGQIDFSLLKDTSYPFVLCIPQAETEQILADHLKLLGGHLERGVKFTHFEGSSVHLEHSDGKKEILTPSYVLACDGAHSQARHALNIPFLGEKLPETYVLADLICTSTYPHDQMHLFITPTHTVGLLPLPQPHLRRVFSRVPGHDPNPTLDLPYFQRLLDAAAGHGAFRLKEAPWMSTFHIHRRITPHMRYGNLFLLGDAAHIHSPAGGQGLNTSVQDAFNLGWKLAQVLKGSADPSLLDSYESERRPVALSVLKGTTRATRLLPHVYKLLPFLLRSRTLVQKMVRSMSELSIRYPTPTPWRDLFWGGPKPGQRAPDIFPGTDYTLLTFGTTLSPSDFPNFDLQEHPLHSPLAPRYHAHRPCYYLIRPDGHIATRSRCLKLLQTRSLK